MIGGGPTGRPSRDDLIARARALATKLRDRAGEAEKQRRLPDQTVADVIAAGSRELFGRRAMAVSTWGGTIYASPQWNLPAAAAHRPG